ncbi:hypothetical protein F4802DRAFT_598122 [Xylaria palmicola]|nr:hypothetical protein F4802DRAFT_598122 [Xylaria palmicola]
MAVSAVGTFFIIVVVFLVFAAIGWVVFTQLRARRLGLPSPPLSSYIPFVRSSNQSPYGPPQPRGAGIRGWFNDRFHSLKNPRSASGAYEPSAPAGRRGFGPLDPDEAWDARVGNETYGVGGAYYPDEQELEDRGHHHGRGGGGGGGLYTGSEYQMNLPGDGAEENRGRSPNPRPSARDAPVGRPSPAAGDAARQNPFDDAAAEPSNLSLRGVSPRPIDTHKAAATPAGAGAPTHESPTSVAERRSVFREDV